MSSIYYSIKQYTKEEKPVASNFVCQQGGKKHTTKRSSSKIGNDSNNNIFGMKDYFKNQALQQENAVARREEDQK